MVDYPVVELAITRSFRTTKKWHLHEAHEPADISTVAEFIQADTPEKMKVFAKEWQPLLYYAGNTYVAFPGLSHEYGEYSGNTLDDYLDARSLLSLALSLRSLLDNRDTCDIATLERLGFFFEYFSPSEWCGDCEGVQMEDWMMSLRGKNYAAYLLAATHDLNTPISENDLIGVSEWESKYRQFFNERRGKKLLLEDDDHSYVFGLATGVFPNTKDGVFQLVSEALDELITLHFYDIRTASVNGGREQRKCGSLLSSLWYCAIQGFSSGRTGRCNVCGKPYISKGERGKPRKYCSEACSKWAQRNPGKTRGSLKDATPAR